VKEKATIEWCTSKPCSINVIGSTQGKEKAILYDGENQYSFENNETNTGIKIEQNGLSPLKEYRIELHYNDFNGNEVAQTNTISGEYLVK
jgi:hypothetical protein